MQFLITTSVLPKDATQHFLMEDEIVAGPFFNKVWHGDRVTFAGTPCGNCDYKATVDLFAPSQKPDVFISFSDGLGRSNMVNLPPSLPRFLFSSHTECGGGSLLKTLDYAVRGKFKGVIVSNRQHAHFFREAGIRYVFWIPGLTPGCIDFNSASARKNSISFFDVPERYQKKQQDFLGSIVARKLPVCGSPLPMYEGLQLLSGSTIGLCLSDNGEINHHVFETSCAGAMILCEELSPKSGLNLFFHEGESIVTFKNKADMLEKAAYYIAHENEAAKIAAKGHEVYEKYFTSVARRARILSILEGREKDPRFLLVNEPRCGLKPVATQAAFNLLRRRIGFYESLQELSLVRDSISVNVATCEFPQVASDVSDLLKVKVTLKGLSTEEGDSMLRILSLLGAGCAKDSSPLSGGDVLVVGSASFANPEIVRALSLGYYASVFVPDIDVSETSPLAMKLRLMGFKDVAGRPGLFKMS
jgi:hypothetical protein